MRCALEQLSGLLKVTLVASEGKEQRLGNNVAGGRGERLDLLSRETGGAWSDPLLSSLEGNRKSSGNSSSAGLAPFWPLSNPLCLVFLLLQVLC